MAFLGPSIGILSLIYLFDKRRLKSPSSLTLIGFIYYNYV